MRTAIIAALGGLFCFVAGMDLQVLMFGTPRTITVHEPCNWQSYYKDTLPPTHGEYLPLPNGIQMAPKGWKFTNPNAKKNYWQPALDGKVPVYSMYYRKRTMICRDNHGHTAPDSGLLNPRGHWVCS